MTDDFDKLLAENPPTEAYRAWARAVLASPAALLQDQSRDLSHWLADKPDARRHARKAAAAIAKPCEWTNCPTRVGNVCCNERSA